MAKEKDILVQIGNYLGSRARAKFKSNVDLAYASDVDEKTIRRVLAGEQNLSIKVLKRICEALDVKLLELFNAIDV